MKKFEVEARMTFNSSFELNKGVVTGEVVFNVNPDVSEIHLQGAW